MSFRFVTFIHGGWLRSGAGKLSPVSEKCGVEHVLFQRRFCPAPNGYAVEAVAVVNPISVMTVVLSDLRWHRARGNIILQIPFFGAHWLETSSV